MNDKLFNRIIIVGIVFFTAVILSSLNLKDKDVNIFNKKAVEVRDNCFNDKEKYGNNEVCYSVEFKSLAKENGHEFSFNVLKELQKLDLESRGCHLIAHGIGEGSYEKSPNDWRNLVRNMTSACNYGAVHGVLSEYIDSLPEKGLTKDVVPTICGENPRADCNHIVGHLILVETDANIDKALNFCDVFESNVQKGHCYTGVFMEYQTALNLIEHGLVDKSWLDWPKRLDGMKKMCEKYQGLKGESCWEEIAHMAVSSFSSDAKKVFDFCGSSHILDGAKKCRRHSIGIIGGTKNFNLNELKDICSLPQKDDPSFTAECYPHLISSALSTIPEDVPQAVAFCGSLENKDKYACFSMIGNVGNNGSLDKSLLKASCQKAGREYIKLCESGGNTYSFLRSID